uniref:Uncharacterized protein n=1 Tax=Pseudomonas fluorescens (strain SBW25) TaxID=216595 RepID=A4V7Q1_PSEFS|nr:hypothetical protein [Pseudomonas fluorescens]CAM96174.1 hypothetical protein pQBR0142 [Pseudomonas fluorescens SBW25]
MTSEPFVMRDEDRALEWVRVFSESCSVDSEMSAGLLASLCGFGSWDVMMFAIANMPPTPCDEKIPSDQLLERHRRYIAIMTHEHSIKPPIAFMVSHHLSPSTGADLKKFCATDLLREYEDTNANPDYEEFEIEQLFAPEASELGLGVVLPLAFEHFPIWEPVFDFLGWEVDELYAEYEVVGAPSYITKDPAGDSLGFPIYLSHSLPAPLFDRQLSVQPTIRLQQCACVGDFTSDWAQLGCPGFLLLTAYPQITEFNGKFYTCVGQAYLKESNQWVDLLLNKACKDVRALITQNLKVTEGFRGATKLGERTEAFGKRIALLLSGFDPYLDEIDDWCLVAMESSDGWYVVRAVECHEYDFDDLEPYMLAPLRKF